MSVTHWTAAYSGPRNLDSESENAALRKRLTTPQEVLAKLEQVGIVQFARLVGAHVDEGML